MTASTAPAKKTAPARKGTAAKAAPAPSALEYKFVMEPGAGVKATPNYLKGEEKFSPGAASVTAYAPMGDLEGANLDPTKVKVEIIFRVIPV